MTESKELYKKYRPRTWGNIIGQDKVVSSLRSAIKEDKLPTAYGFFGSHGCGKALHKDTLIPTPQGFRKMGEISIGDKVLGAHMQPTEVLEKYCPEDPVSYRVLFSSGSSALASAGHLWTVLINGEKVTLSTQELVERFKSEPEIDVELPVRGSRVHRADGTSSKPLSPRHAPISVVMNEQGRASLIAPQEGENNRPHAHYPAEKHSNTLPVSEVGEIVKEIFSLGGMRPGIDPSNIPNAPFKSDVMSLEHWVVFDALRQSERIFRAPNHVLSRVGVLRQALLSIDLTADVIELDKVQALAAAELLLAGAIYHPSTEILARTADNAGTSKNSVASLTVGEITGFTLNMTALADPVRGIPSLTALHLDMWKRGNDSFPRTVAELLISAHTGDVYPSRSESVPRYPANGSPEAPGCFFVTWANLTYGWANYGYHRLEEMCAAASDNNGDSAPLNPRGRTPSRTSGAIVIQHAQDGSANLCCTSCGCIVSSLPTQAVNEHTVNTAGTVNTVDNVNTAGTVNTEVNEDNADAANMVFIARMVGESGVRISGGEFIDGTAWNGAGDKWEKIIRLPFISRTVSSAEHEIASRGIAPVRVSSISQEEADPRDFFCIKVDASDSLFLFGETFLPTHNTSTAKVLAKALNCTNLQDGQEPCNDCESCRSIDSNDSLDVTYESMANKGGVDDVREIVRSATLQTPGKKAVFILDEVHNLSKAAFDALLIPLEEDSMPALFILCSTEPNKIPSTVLSRIQSRHFPSLPYPTLREYVREIADKEEISISDKEIADVVKAGRGSVRDTLTALDRFSSEGGGEATGDSEHEFAKNFIKILFNADSDQKCLALALGVIDKYAEDMDGTKALEVIFQQSRAYVLGLDKRGKDSLGTRGNAFDVLSDLMLLSAEYYDRCVNTNSALDPKVYIDYIAVSIVKKHPLAIF